MKERENRGSNSVGNNCIILRARSQRYPLSAQGGQHGGGGTSRERDMESGRKDLCRLEVKKSVEKGQEYSMTTSGS